MITRDAALRLLNEWITNPNLIKHCLAVEAAMLAYAEHFSMPKEERWQWSIAGLLHDADWERFPDEHPKKIIEHLQGMGLSESLTNAIASHGFEFGVEPETHMAHTLRAVDELTGLIVATALVRESKKLSDVTVESIQKKWNTAGFARGVNREDIELGAAEIGVPLPEHIAITLKAMQSISDDLGL